MKELIYQVEFKSDIVLPATSNNEGNISQLDFIPGSNFLGMVAQNYDKFEDSFRVFHSADVKFSDATILKDDKQTYKMPLSFFHEKLDEKLDNTTIYNHHKIEDFGKFNQLKQLRNGYITKDNETISIEYNYSQKSAYDKEKRTSLDSSMFGYSAIKCGTKWQFSIKVNDTICEEDLELLKNSIVGTKRLGESKSAQYGLVEITQKGQTEDIEDKTSNEIILYANSRLALVDEYADPTYDLKYLFDGLKSENIDYSKCQIKTSTFTPYNSARQTKDYERLCINKGSVIVLKDIDKSIIPKFVGAYQSEGFGELLLNPKFLSDDKFELKKECKDNNTQAKITITTHLATFLQQKEKTKYTKLDILNEVDTFIKNNKDLYKNIKNSQWGNIRSICTSNKDVITEIEKYITPPCVKAWDKNQIDTLLNGNDSIEFIKLISIQMPKQGDK